VNIEWKNFFDEKGRPRREILKELKTVGLEPSTRIYVLSGDGVRSAAVTMALRDLGYEKAGNLVF
ncbi:MAG: ABC transporter ATP-binding protein, partial [Bdellovibrionia bacterium]